MPEYNLGRAHGRIEIDARDAIRSFKETAQAGEEIKTKVQSSLAQTSQTLDNVGRSMQKAGKVATVGLTLPIVAMGVKATSAAEALNESINAVNVVFGEGADQLHEFAKVASSEAGLSMREFNQLVTPVGAQLRNVGYGADEAADASINLAKRSADMASVFDTDVSEALSAIQAGLRGEADPLERFGVGLSAAAVQAEGLRLGLMETTVNLQEVEAAQLGVEKATAKVATAIKTHGEGSLEAREAASQLEAAETKLATAMEGQTGELDANAAMQARLSLLMRQTDRIAGDFKNTIDGTANSGRELAAEVENASAQMGQKLLPIKKALIDAASSLIDRFNNLSPAGQNIAMVMAAIAAAIGPLLIVLGTLARSVSSLIDLHQKLAPKIATAGTKVASFARTVGRAALSIARATARMIASFVRMAAQAVASAARATAATVASVARQTAAWAVLGARSLAAAARVALAWLIAMGPIALVIAAVIGLVALIVANWDKIVRFTRNLWEKVKAAFTRGKEAVVAQVRAVVDWVRNAWETLTGAVAGAVQRYYEAVANGFAAVVNFFRELPGRIKGAIGDLAGMLYNLARDAIESLVRGLGSIIGAVTRKAQEIKDAVVAKLNPANWFSTPEEHYRKLWGDAFEAIADEGERKLSSISAVVGSIQDETTPRLPRDSRGYGGAGAAASVSTVYQPTIKNEVHNPSNADLTAASMRALRVVATEWGT